MRGGALIVVMLSTVATVSSVSNSRVLHEEWTTFKLMHKKQYNQTEDIMRKKIFIQNKYKIAKHNQKFERGEVSYSLKLNKYADLAHEEHVRMISGFKKTNRTIAPKPAGHFIKPANMAVPTHMDWRELGAVTPVKDQEKCAACWAFSATGALESHNFRQTSVLETLSEQNLIDCSSDWGNDGCSGGLMKYAYSYVDDNNGIDSDTKYPYQSIQEYCMYMSEYSAARDVGFVYVTGGNEQTLMEAVASVGPVSVAVDATLDTFHLYGSGIYCDTRCSNQSVNHAVLVVGYGTDLASNENFWIVKNSVGTSWGENGYIKIARDRDNCCGIASDATYPLV